MSESRKDHKLYLLDIIDACERISSYTKGKTEKEFAEDQKTVDAVIRNIEVIGEAASKVPQEVRKRIPDVPWNEVVAMRNKVIHEYFDVNIPIVWKTVKNDIPKLKKAISKVVKDKDSG